MATTPTQTNATAPSVAGGGRKFDSGKPDLSLNPPVALREMAKAFAFGAKKYSPYNFEAGLSARRLLSAAQRHIAAVLDGEELDPEVYELASSGAHHLGHAMASLAMYLRCRELGTLVDDRSPNRPLTPVLKEAVAAAPCAFSLVCQRIEGSKMYYRAYNFPEALRGRGELGRVRGKGVYSYIRPWGSADSILLPGDADCAADEIVLDQNDGWTPDLVTEVVELVRQKAKEAGA